MRKKQETQHLRPPAGLSRAEKTAFRAAIASGKAGKGPISPDVVIDYVRSRSRLRILQKLLAAAVAKTTAGGPPKPAYLN